jgi:response regulator NasT
MNRTLRVAVADDEADMRDFYRRFLPLQGHQVVCAAATGRELLEGCRKERPDLAIADIRMPDMDGIEAADAINKEQPMPVVLVSAYHDRETQARAEADHVMAFLVKPVTENDLGPAIGLAMRRFEQFQQLRQEAVDLKQALEDRKQVERAKGVVMRRLGVDEQEAFRLMRKLSSDRNWKLVEVSKILIESDVVFKALEETRAKR